MRIAISDYSGHAFPAQLSRELARRGHQVLHVSADSFQSPKGRVEWAEGDPISLTVASVRTARPFAKQNFVRRRPQEIEIGRHIAERLIAFAPDAVISGNAPLDTQRAIQRATSRLGIPFVFWVQDLYSEAIGRLLTPRLGPFGRLIGAMYRRLEARLLRRSAHVVVIAPAFVPSVRALANIPPERISVIENWAPLDDLPPLPRDNDWALANLPPAPIRLVYAGTLGMKHDPGLIAAVARALPIEVLVFSQGPAADWLTAQGLPNLQVRDWLPVADLPTALAAADLLLVILEPDAGAFSVPSKVLTYLSVGRAVAGAIPLGNRAAEMICESGAGIVVAPGDAPALVEAVRRLVVNPAERAAAGRAGRAFAERTFAIGPIADRFERICRDVTGRDAGVSPR